MVEILPVIIILAGIDVCAVQGASVNVSISRLMNDTIDGPGYDTRIIPDTPGSKWAVISIEYMPVKIIHIKPSAQEIAMAAVVPLAWYDSRLAWNPDDYGDVWEYTVDLDSIWFPKVGHLFSSNANYNLAGTGSGHTGMIKNHGLVLFQVANTYVSTCVFDVTMFPFDRQVCEQRFSTWPYGSPFSMMILEQEGQQFSAPVRNNWYEPHPEWELSTTTEIKTVNASRLMLGMVDELFVTFHLTRKYTFYIYSIVVPAMTMSGLVLTVFMIPPDAGEKLSFGVTILLTFSIFQLSIDSSLPKTSESTPLISTAILILQVISATSISIAVFVLNLHHMSAAKGRIPRGVRFILKVLGKNPAVPAHASRMFADAQLGARISDSVTELKEAADCDTDPESKYIRKPSGRFAEEESFAEEWKAAALIIDRTLLTICMIIVVVTMCTLSYKFATNRA